jgi:hypothetical protein
MPSASARVRSCWEEEAACTTSGGLAWARPTPSWCSIAAVLLLPDQVERLGRVLQGFCPVSLQTAAPAKPRPADRTTRAGADTSADHLLPQRAPFRVAFLERRSRA